MKIKTSLVKDLLIMIFSIIVLTGCNQEKLNPSPQTISESLTMTYHTGPSISRDDYIEVYFENPTKYCIKFPKDYGIRIFSDEKNSTEIENNTIYFGSNPRVLGPKGSIGSIRSVVFSPDLSNELINKPTKFYAVITGHICKDNSIIISKRIPFLVNP